MIVRTYSELIQLQTLEERYHYLALRGKVSEATFGFDRYMNQAFYRSAEWKELRDVVIVRDNGCDLAHPEHPIHSHVYIHHMNPMTPEDIKNGVSSILDSEYLISTTLRTHNAIHFGNERQLPRPFVSRRAGDTKLW